MMLRIIGPFGFISHTQEHKGAGNAGLVPGKIFGRHDGICAFDALRSRCMLDGCDSLCGEGFVIDDSRSAIQIGKRNFRTHAVGVDVVHAEDMGFVIIVPHEKHLCTEVTDLVQLAFRRCPGNNDLCVWNPKKRCGIADRASVVPGRDGRNTAGQFLRCQGQKLIIK